MSYILPSVREVSSYSYVLLTAFKFIDNDSNMFFGEIIQLSFFKEINSLIFSATRSNQQVPVNLAYVLIFGFQLLEGTDSSCGIWNQCHTRHNYHWNWIDILLDNKLVDKRLITINLVVLRLNWTLQFTDLSPL